MNPKATIILFIWLLAFAAQSRAQDFSAEEVAHRALERRAVEAVIWGMPTVNFDLMYQAMIRDAKAGAGSNKIVYWSKLSDWKNQTLTPTRTPFISCRSSIRRTSARSCSKFRRPTRTDRSPAR